MLYYLAKKSRSETERDTLSDSLKFDKTPIMNTNLLQLIQDNLHHIEKMRHDESVSRGDLLDDMRERQILLIKKMVYTANTANYILPINAYDQTDIFLQEGVSVQGN